MQTETPIQQAATVPETSEIAPAGDSTPVKKHGGNAPERAESLIWCLGRRQVMASCPALSNSEGVGASCGQVDVWLPERQATVVKTPSANDTQCDCNIGHNASCGSKRRLCGMDIPLRQNPKQAPATKLSFCAWSMPRCRSHSTFPDGPEHRDKSELVAFCAALH